MWWLIAQKLAKGTIDITAAQAEYETTEYAIDEQKEANKLALQDRTSARNQTLRNDLSSIKASQAARGVEGGAGLYAGKEREAEADIRAMQLEEKKQARQLTYAKDVAKFQRDVSSLGAMLDTGGGIFSGMQGN